MELTTPVETPPEAEAPRGALHALIHEWFVEYNPIYLFSAALVLAGLTLVSCDLAENGALESLGVTAVAELYALALIAGAAFLRRLGARRVAVMVGLLAALYQCDLTMHVETSAFLGTIGFVGACVWIALFAVKLRLLAAALELRLSRSALLVPTFGAAGLALLPQLFRHLAPDSRTTLVALVAFVVAASALWTSRTVESAVGFDYRGRRALRGTWLMWAGGALLHLTYWVVELGIQLDGLVPAALLLTTRWARRERSVWAIVAATLAGVAWLAPSSMPSTALMVSVVLALRAFRAPIITLPAAAAPQVPPYRGAGLEPAEEAPELASEISFGPADPIAIERLLLGVATSLHLCLWTTSATGGLWLAHVPPLDIALVAACGFAAWRGRRWQSATPLVPLATHLAIQLGWLTVPRDATELGTWSIVLGFGLLAAALAVNHAAAARATARRGPCVPEPVQ